MESIQQTLRLYKALTFKNRSSIDSLSRQITTQKTLFTLPLSNHFQQIKQQYDLTLAASKASVDKNIQLQAELQFKQERLKELKQKLYRNFEEIEGLEFEMKRAAGKMKRERKSWQETSRVTQSNEKLRKELQRLHKKKNRLEIQAEELNTKERLKKGSIAKLQEQIAEAQLRYSQQQKAESQRVEKLQQQITRQQQILQSLRRQSDKSSTPQKPNRSIHLQQMIMRIRQQRQNIQD